MDSGELQRRRAERARDRRRRMVRRRIGAVGSLVVVLAASAVAVASSNGGSAATTAATAPHRRRTTRTRGGTGSTHRGLGRTTRGGSTAAALGPATGHPGTDSVPILMYHVINTPPPGAPYPGLYVPAPEFAAQMQALKQAGWVGVTLDQMRAYWTKGARLPPGKPIVLTFDNGYHSQYTEALPILRKLGWVADENIQLTGLPPSQGGMTTGEVRALVRAGWELDTQGMSHADLATADAAELHYQVVVARRRLQRTYGVPVNWFCYPSGQYNPSLIAALKRDGFVGSTTVVPGWAGPSTDPYRLPRLRVLGGTSPSQLLTRIASARGAAPPPGTYMTS